MCLHLQYNNRFCTDCGIEINEYDLVNDSKYTSNYYLGTTKHIPLLNRLLHSLYITEYKNAILQEFKVKDFGYRHSLKDKLLLCIYKVLRDSSYPITFNDLERYSTKIKSKWFKEYKYIPFTPEYVRNVVERFSNKYIKDVDEVINFLIKYSNRPVQKVIQLFFNTKKN